MTVLAIALAAVTLGVAIAAIILTVGRQTHERPGYITDQPRRRDRTTPSSLNEDNLLRSGAGAAAGSSRVRAESGQADLGGDAA